MPWAAIALPDGPVEIARLNKIIQALMDRAEHAASPQASEFSPSQSAIILEEQGRRHAAALA